MPARTCTCLRCRNRFYVQDWPDGRSMHCPYCSSRIFSADQMCKIEDGRGIGNSMMECDCPECGHDFCIPHLPAGHIMFCPHCGSKLNWKCEGRQNETAGVNGQSPIPKANNYCTLWMKCLTFSGRTSRGGYWMFFITNLIIAVLALGLAQLTDFGVYLFYFYKWVMLLPLAAANVRRLHDLNISGWWILLIVIPSVITNSVVIPDILYYFSRHKDMYHGIMILGYLFSFIDMIMMCCAGQKKSNRFGPQPKYPD